MKAKENKLLKDAIVNEIGVRGRQKIKERFSKIEAQSNSGLFSITDKSLNELSSAAFGLNHEIEDNPLRITDETIKDFLEEDEDALDRNISTIEDDDKNQQE